MSDPGMKSINSWNFIWSFFMHKPSVRSWLFQNEPPPLTHVAQALTNSPLLHGYTFTVHDIPKNYSFPDVGDLDTALTTEEGTVLGLTFGLHSAMPVIPSIYAVSKEPSLSDPSAIVRRTARYLLDFNNLSCYIHIEFCWLTSRNLVVTTSVQAVAQQSEQITFPNPAIDCVEVRVFPAVEAQRLLHTARLLDDYTNEGGNGRTYLLPDDFLNPPYKFFVLCEDVDDQPRASLHFLTAGRLHSTHYVNEANSKILRTYEHIIGYHHALFSSSNVVCNKEKLKFGRLWKGYCDTISSSRTKGVYKSIILKKSDSVLGGVDELLSRKSNYSFLCTTGISAHGRIQRLCTHLGIHCSRPEIDNVLFKYVDDNESNDNTGRTVRSEMNNETSFGQVESHCHSMVNSTNSECEVQGSGTVTRYSAASANSIKRRRPEERVRASDSQGQKTFEREGERSSRTASSKCVSSTVLDIKSLLSHDPSLSGDQPSFSAYEEEHITNEEGPCRNVDNMFSEATVPEEDTGNRLTPTLGKKVGGDGVSEIWECAKCGVHIRGKMGNLKRHAIFKHENLRRFQCTFPKCGRKFHNRVNLKRHEHAVHEGRPFKCPQCTRDFKGKAYLDAHIQKTHTEHSKMLICNICGNGFGYRSSLNRHQRIVHERRKGQFPSQKDSKGAEC